MVSSIFLQSSPRQSPQAVTHLSPFFRHEHMFPPHGFVDDILQLHRMNFSRSSGAGSMSVIMGISFDMWSFQPHWVGSSSEFPRFSQITTCRWTLRLWKKAARSVGGNFWGSIAVLLDETMPINFVYLICLSNSPLLPEYISTKSSEPASPTCLFEALGLLISFESRCN